MLIDELFVGSVVWSLKKKILPLCPSSIIIFSGGFVLTWINSLIAEEGLALKGVLDVSVDT